MNSTRIAVIGGALALLAGLGATLGGAATSVGATSDDMAGDGPVAYFILTETITDQAAYADEYIPGVLPFLEKYGAEVLVADFEAEALEGEPADGAVILRFPSEQDVRDFLNDPDYRSLKELRFRITTNAAAVLAPEFEGFSATE